MTEPVGDQPSLSESDLLRAAAEGVVSRADAEALIEWVRRGGRSAPAPLERTKGLNWVSVLYYGGALLMIAACAWFLGDKWEALGSRGVLVVVAIYAAVATWVGVTLRRRGWPVAGGLLITVAVCLTPLATYCIEDLVGWWPAGQPGRYKDYYPWIRASWIVMELAAVATAGFALWFVRFGFLTAPLAFSLWFFSMDLAAYAGGEWWDSLDGRRWVSMAVGLATLAFGFVLDRGLTRRPGDGRQDFAFWCFLFGMLAFWGALTSMDSDSELGKALYALLNVGFLALAVWSRRVTFLVFGGVGVHAYLGHLAVEVFKDSALFPFALVAVGLSMILFAVAMQRLWRARPA